MSKFEKALYIVCISAFAVSGISLTISGNLHGALYAGTSLLWCTLAFKFKRELDM